MHWLKEHGITNSYSDYLELPVDVLDDARLLMEAEQAGREIEERRGGNS